MWITQDADGWIKIHYHYQRKTSDIWHSSGSEITKREKPNKNWEDSLINLDTHDYEIKDGILTKLDKAKKPTPRKHAELACKYFMDDTVQIQFRHSGPRWHNTENPEFIDRVEYREKPKTKTIRFRNFIKDGIIFVTTTDEVGNVKWLGEWREVTIND